MLFADKKPIDFANFFAEFTAFILIFNRSIGKADR